MSDQLDLFETWTCHARPVRLGGKPCGHVNQGGSFTRLDSRRMEYCAACGCTRKASEDRVREAVR